LHEYSKFIKPSELEGWANNADLNAKRIIGMHYNPITKHYKLDKGVDVNYLLHTQKD